MKYYSFFLLFGIILFSGCNETEKDQTGVFVGGQIMNPYNPYFILSKDNKVIDTLILDQNNQFGKKFENLEAGVYNFNHPPENQMMYLEPGDSILVWLNTLQFDESLNFSGTGAAKSSFLLDMFLNNERNNKLMLSYYKIKPTEFAKITDSIKDFRKEKLKALNENKKFAEPFLKLANSTIDYDFYRLRERYTFLVKKYYNELAQQIPRDFHDYRENINFNDTILKNYYGYLNFIKEHLRTRSIERCLENLNTNADCFELHSLNNIKYRINLADSLINEKEIKNIFINRLAVQGLVYAESSEKIDSILQILDNINFEGKNLPDLKLMAQVQKSLLPGNTIGNIPLTNFQGKSIQLKNISNKPIVTYHWSLEVPEHYKWQHTIISNLREKYPELEFVGINIDESPGKSWKNVVRAYNMKQDGEYRLTSPNINRDLLKNYLNKLIFLDTNGKIISGEAQLNTPNFERQILEFLNN